MIAHKIGNYLSIELKIYRKNIDNQMIIENFDNAENVSVKMSYSHKPSIILNTTIKVNTNSIDLYYDSKNTDLQGVYCIIVYYTINDVDYVFNYEPIELIKNTTYYPELDNIEVEPKEINLNGQITFNGLAGRDGHTPIKGIDYFDGKDGLIGKDGYTPVKNVDYFDGVTGKDGKDGNTPVKGVDYFDGLNGYTPVKGIDYFDGINGINGKDGYTPVKGVDYFDGLSGYTPIKGVDYFDGINGKDGVDGKDAVFNSDDYIKNANTLNDPQDASIWLNGNVYIKEIDTEMLVLNINPIDDVTQQNLFGDFCITTLHHQNNQSIYTSKINSAGSIDLWNWNNITTVEGQDNSVNKLYTLTNNGDGIYKGNVTGAYFIGDGSLLTGLTKDQITGLDDTLNNLSNNISTVGSISHNQNSDSTLQSNNGEHTITLDNTGTLNIENITLSGKIIGDGSLLTDLPVTNGINGIDGYTPVKGVDYFDGLSGYTPVKGVDYFDGINGVDGKDGTISAIGLNKIPVYNGSTYVDSMLTSGNNAIGINCIPNDSVYMLDLNCADKDVRFYGDGTGGLGFVLESTASNGVGGRRWYFNTTPDDGSFGINYDGLTGTYGLPGTKYFYILPNGKITASNTITSTGFIKTGGSSTQILMADGSVSQVSYMKNVTEWKQTNATSGLFLGTVGTSAGTFAQSLPTFTSTSTSIKRANYANVVTTTNQVLGVRNTELMYSVKAGFTFFSRCGVSTWTNGGRFFAGLSIANTVVSANPSALNDTIGFGCDSGDNGLLYVISKNTGTVNKTSTTLTLTSGKMYDMYLYCDPNGTSIKYSITDINTQVTVTGTINTVPTASTLLNFGVNASNAALTPVTSINLSINKIYLESNY